ncbi:hypothetical protein TI24_07850 [Vibrio vulnificus]|jgi:uncharacterized membrane protein|uniref:hypothetical protein n=1 Tax=Vibrio vulnificus TaxID=672 RepID=UPI000B5A9147|nr:hypothetical protein [Vibrio vulnificus]ASJ37525.1 hypothetical protein VVCECT4999_01880 [Vibrio vulnificus]PNG69103.1 hypothetical protein TI24_07850 [Vibrio vulnificus]PNG75059.1 hypothetical protein TI31_09050 [Vibrio vulnificus]POC41259.1 hypothetical protein CRN50_01840 [Vibrio vulnificus]
MREYWIEYKKLVEPLIPKKLLSVYNSKYFELLLVLVLLWALVASYSFMKLFLAILGSNE